MNGDEYLEVTPKSVRIRKKYLTELDRVKAQRDKKKVVDIKLARVYYIRYKV